MLPPSPVENLPEESGMEPSKGFLQWAPSLIGWTSLLWERAEGFVYAGPDQKDIFWTEDSEGQDVPSPVLQFQPQIESQEHPSRKVIRVSEDSLMNSSFPLLRRQQWSIAEANIHPSFPKQEGKFSTGLLLELYPGPQISVTSGHSLLKVYWQLKNK